MLTTPNVHSVASRLRFALTDNLRQFNEKSDPTHYQPLFLHPFRLLVQREGFRAAHLATYPAMGTVLQSRPMIRYLVEGARAFLPEELPGEVLIIWLAKDYAE